LATRVRAGRQSIWTKPVEEETRPTFKLLLHAEPSHLSLTTSDDQSIKRCRPHVTWRYLGESAWRQELFSPFVGLKTEQHRLSFETKAGPLRASITIGPQVPDAWEFSGMLTNDGDKPIELARFHYLHGTIDKKYGLLKEFGRLIRHGEHTKPERAFLEEFWASMSVRWPRLAEPIHDTADWAVAVDVGALLTAWNEPGWVCGCIGPGTAFGEVGLQTMPDEPTFYMGILLDNIAIDPGEARALEHAIVHYGDLQDGLHFWAEQCARLHPKARVPAPMVGYCSWYQVGLYNWANEARLIRVALNDVGLNPDIRWRLAASRHTPSVRLVDNCLIVDNQPPHSLRIAQLTAE